MLARTLSEHEGRRFVVPRLVWRAADASQDKTFVGFQENWLTDRLTVTQGYDHLWWELSKIARYEGGCEEV